MEITALIVAYPCWVLIHEGLHALCVVLLGGRVNRFKPWPHMTGGRFVWGSIRWTGEFSDKQRGWVSIVPRIPAVIAIFLLPFVSGWLWWLLLGGAIDQFINSIGYSEGSDLKKWSNYFGWNPWWSRIIGIALSLVWIFF